MHADSLTWTVDGIEPFLAKLVSTVLFLSGEVKGLLARSETAEAEVPSASFETCVYLPLLVTMLLVHMVFLLC